VKSGAAVASLANMVANEPKFGEVRSKLLVARGRIETALSFLEGPAARTL
jgi:hypothetical protein